MRSNDQLLLEKEHLLVNHFAVVKGKDRSL